MEISTTKVLDAYRIEPKRIDDHRGSFYEAWRQEALAEALGRPFEVRQGNFAVSRRDTLRGFHFTVSPPGQAKLVTCVRGALTTAVVDLRVGSPTFGEFEMVDQDEDSAVGVFAAEGLGVAFIARTDGARMAYLCSTEFVAQTMLGVRALDPDLGIPWGCTEPLMSEKDAGAPTVAECVAAGVLPRYETCQALYAGLQRGERP
ncbi:dTDP-4-dehydrorhamnose 3,5-epimerase family protein [Dactylosporangium sp. NPDC048998]|uniref:dTDP-4-dehydrorhamnose 3,5-epimerase family protein n=1 Tax=Dactylosporangium sp. NPDC048998 TaxID=3363976 RepID=UPI003713FE9D